MTAILSVVLETPDPGGASALAHEAFGVGDRIEARAADAPGAGFRGFALSLVVSRPSAVDRLVGAALELGATTSKPVAKSLWGYGGAVVGPDRTPWTVASKAKKEKESDSPDDADLEDLVLLLGVADVKASKRFYGERGMVVAKGFGGRYVEFERSPTGITLALLRRDALAKNLGVEPAGSGPPGIAIRSEAGSFTDPDGFTWEAVGAPAD